MRVHVDGGVRVVVGTCGAVDIWLGSPMQAYLDPDRVVCG